MIECRKHLRFAMKPRDTIGIGREMAGSALSATVTLAVFWSRAR
jgi:hypothetical protein